jgi:3-phenylpropionate/cinnamic acid dioxygenase small subunit
VSDHENVLDTIHRYCEAIDAQRRDEWLDCFADDALWEIRSPDGSVARSLRGRAQLQEFFDGRTPPPSQRHLITNTRVLVDGDRATSTSYFFTTSLDDGASKIGTVGQYADQLVRGADGVWRFTERIASTGPPS